VVLAAALLLLPFRGVMTPPTVMLAFVPVVIVLARLFGVRVSTVAALLAFGALDFLFVPPYYHLSVRSAAEVVGMVVFLVVALAAGQQTGRLRERERAALRRQAALEVLGGLSARIATATSVDDIAAYVVEQVVHGLGARRAALYVPSGHAGAPRCLAAAGDAAPSSSEEALVRWVAVSGRAVGAPERSGVPGVPANAAIRSVVFDCVFQSR
jgi:K+-sensing histidine kinase KdpD